MWRDSNGGGCGVGVSLAWRRGQCDWYRLSVESQWERKQERSLWGEVVEGFQRTSRDFQDSEGGGKQLEEWSCIS